MCSDYLDVVDVDGLGHHRGRIGLDGSGGYQNVLAMAKGYDGALEADRRRLQSQRLYLLGNVVAADLATSIRRFDSCFGAAGFSCDSGDSSPDAFFFDGTADDERAVFETVSNCGDDESGNLHFCSWCFETAVPAVAGVLPGRLRPRRPIALMWLCCSCVRQGQLHVYIEGAR